MRILFAVGVGILPEQRIKRWQMVSQLYAKLGSSLSKLGHQVYYYVHPEAYHEDVPYHLAWISPDHQHFPVILENLKPDFVFCWNGSSPGDVSTATIASAYGAKMVFSEQGWFPQSTTLYFDMAGCNGKCGTKNTEFPLLSPGQKRGFLSRRNSYITSIGQQENYDLNSFRIRPPDLKKPVFVPLQDERDLNIIQDSPFKLMDEFVGFLSTKYPGASFIVRPHPKYPSPELSAYDNVELDNPKRPMFETLKKCGLVFGINSTTLLESALLGYTVVSCGESLGTGTGVFYDIRDFDSVSHLSDVGVETQKAESALYHLLCVKQILRDDLDNPVKVMQSGFFKELLNNQNWNSIYR